MKLHGLMVRCSRVPHNNMLCRVTSCQAVSQERVTRFIHMECYMVFIFSVVDLKTNTKHLQSLEVFCYRSESTCLSPWFVFRPDAGWKLESCISACLVTSSFGSKWSWWAETQQLWVHLVFFREAVHVPKAHSLVCVQLLTYCSVTSNVLSKQECRKGECIIAFSSNSCYEDGLIHA